MQWSVYCTEGRCILGDPWDRTDVAARTRRNGHHARRILHQLIDDDGAMSVLRGIVTHSQPAANVTCYDNHEIMATVEDWLDVGRISLHFEPATQNGGGGQRASETQDDSDQDDEVAQETEETTSWVEIELVGEDGNPIPREPFVVTLPDGTVKRGSLGSDGVVRIEGFDAGNCLITFPKLDTEAWEVI